MADARQRTTLGNVFRFSIRGLGLSGLLAAAVGGVLLASEMPALGPVGSVEGGARKLWAHFDAAINGGLGDAAKTASWIVGIGAIAVLLWIAVELLGALTLVTGRG